MLNKRNYKVAKYVRVIHGIEHFPINVCRNCGEEDDPETAARWEDDEDGHRICEPCRELSELSFDQLLERFEDVVGTVAVASHVGAYEFAKHDIRRREELRNEVERRLH